MREAQTQVFSTLAVFRLPLPGGEGPGVLLHELTVQHPVLFWGSVSLLLGTAFPAAPIVWVVSADAAVPQPFLVRCLPGTVGGAPQEVRSLIEAGGCEHRCPTCR